MNKNLYFVCPQYTVHTKRVPFDSDNEVSPYSLSPLSNKRYGTSYLLPTEHTVCSQIVVG